MLTFCQKISKLEIEKFCFSDENALFLNETDFFQWKVNILYDKQNVPPHQ